LSAEAILFFSDEIQDWGRPYFSDLYKGDLAAGSLKVTLNSFSSSRVSWDLRLRKSDPYGFARRTIATVSSLYKRLRSAPESGNRTFNVNWQLCSEDKQMPVEAKYSFNQRGDGKDRFSLKLASTTRRKPSECMGLIEELATGNVTFGEARSELEEALGKHL
jgi:hypothetical protein